MNSLEKQIDLLWILVEGCTKHMAYRARKAPSTECPTCANMWIAKTVLGDPPVRVPQEYSGTGDARCTACYDGTSHSTSDHYRNITSTVR